MSFVKVFHSQLKEMKICTYIWVKLQTVQMIYSSINKLSLYRFSCSNIQTTIFKLVSSVSMKTNVDVISTYLKNELLY